MYFRFAAALLLVVLVSMAGVQLEKQTLELRRAVSVQYYQTDLLLEMLVRLRLETQRLTAPPQLAAAGNPLKRQKPSPAGNPRPQNAGDGTEHLNSHETPRSRLPLLRFRQLFNPEGID